MGAAIVLAAILSLAFSTMRGRSAQPAAPAGGEEIVTINNQPITLRRNPALTVLLAPPAPIVVDPAPVAEEAPPPTAEPPTSVPPTEVPAQPEESEPPTATPIPAQPSVNEIITTAHTVAAGETLYSLRSRYITSIALMAEYGISQDSLTPGAQLDIPVGNPAFCPDRRPYAVGEGETAFSISRKVNISTADLQTINGLNANFDIQAGQILCVP